MIGRLSHWALNHGLAAECHHVCVYSLTFFTSHLFTTFHGIAQTHFWSLVAGVHAWRHLALPQEGRIGGLPYPQYLPYLIAYKTHFFPQKYCEKLPCVLQNEGMCLTLRLATEISLLEFYLSTYLLQVISVT